MSAPAQSAAVLARTRGRPVLVSRPSGSSLLHVSHDLVTLAADARRLDAHVYLLPGDPVVDDARAALEAGGLVVTTPGPLARARLKARWHAAATARRMQRWSTALAASFWHEAARECRRHAADQHLPGAMRERLRAAVRWTTQRAAVSGAAAPLPRRLLRLRAPASGPAPILPAIRGTLARAGIAANDPFVALEIDGPIGRYREAIDWLRGAGYKVVRVAARTEPIGDASVIELPSEPGARAPDLAVVQAARFVVCASRELQHLACLIGTPAVTIDARDPFSAYPVPEDGIFTLGEAVNLDTGHWYSRDERLDESFFRQVRNCGFRGTPSGQMRAAVEEMHDGLTHGWREAASQARFRSQVLEAGAAMAGRVPHVAVWGPDDGFIGEGRIAACQAGAAA